MRYQNVKNLIEATVKENGENGITGNGLQNVLLTMLEYTSTLHNEEDVMYGVEWDVTVADPAMTRIGNMALHRQLPIQNRMKGCLLDDNGNVVEYLPPTSWLGATRDGSRGQVMVKVPYHYRKFETDGNIRRAKISEYPLPGYHYVPEMYISAYEATVQRSTNMLCSVVNSDPDYRGGYARAGWDGTYRSLLGRPASAEHGKTFQSWARNRNASATSEWNILDYTCWKAVQWLYLVEYANRNSQLPFIAERDANGNKQGGLGMGATTAPSTIGDWNSQYAFIPCGYTDSFGNGSGEIPYTMYNEDGTVFAEVMANRYRGIENPFGHLGKICCGCLCVSKSSETDIYTTADTSLYNFDATDGYTKMYSIPYAGGYFNDITFGEQGDIIPASKGGGSTTFWCDNIWMSSRDPEVIRPLSISGSSKNATTAGMFAFDSIYGASNANNGTRLCFIPKNNE